MIHLLPPPAPAFPQPSWPIIAPSSPAQLLCDLVQLLLCTPQLNLQVVAGGVKLCLQLLQLMRGVGQPLAQLALLFLEGTARHQAVALSMGELR